MVSPTTSLQLASVISNPSGLYDDAAMFVRRFVEKPNAATAKQYLEEDGYIWNTGIFMLKVSVWLNALKAFRSDIANVTLAAWNAKRQEKAFMRPYK